MNSKEEARDKAKHYEKATEYIFAGVGMSMGAFIQWVDISLLHRPWWGAVFILPITAICIGTYHLAKSK